MRLWTFLTALGATAICAAALTAQGGVAATKHNMNIAFGGSATSGIIQDSQVCLPCHAPHNQPVGAADTVGYLWNHVMPTYAASGYTLYAGTAVGGSVESSTVVGLDGTSKKCLSCHDGSVAVDSYGGYTFAAAGTTSTFATTDTLPNRHKLGVSNDFNGNSTAAFVVGAGGDLSHEHPVGVTYPASGFVNPSTWTRTGYTNSSGSVVSYVKADGTAGGTTSGGGFTLEGGNVAGTGVVGCGTCHTPHGDTYNFLVVSNYGSQLCMTCHTR